MDSWQPTSTSIGPSKELTPERGITSPTFDDLVSRWDRNSKERFDELSSNADPAYRSLTNLICNYVAERSSQPVAILDVGCGVGFLATSLAHMGHAVTAIDPSAASVGLAKASLAQGQSSPTFIPTTLEALDPSLERSFDVIVANMTLHCVPKIATFMSSAARFLSSDGYVLATIPNPDTYLQGRTDLDLRGVDLRRDQILEIPFRIHAQAPHTAPVFYFHHPFRTYLDSAEAARLRISNFHIPEQIGAGRPRDIAVLEFRKHSLA